ncbi:uncharacterized protein LOC126779123 [Nymphalis io]|uniref:uncharacterized protein LOC126779123 n=1 Tax=Inachis io TaxID=171585 RepID=UPI002168F2B3|nr:uncharacterized protein LOC126779123 [Nymphalis io]
MKPCLTGNQGERNLEQKFKSDFNTKNETNNSLRHILSGDLYIIGRLWIEALKTALIGMNFNLIPVVEAAKIPETPQKPSSMKYTDLPLYKSPHFEYKDHVEAKSKCSEANVKLLHRSLLPYVKCYRQVIAQNICLTKCAAEEKYINACNAIRNVKKDFKQRMRDPNNIPIRQATVAIGGTTGYVLGGGGGIPRRIFCTSLGFITAGALCFPRETDEIFRNAAYSFGKVFIAVYNKWCGKEFVMREKLACKDELPPPPPTRKSIPCPSK